MQTSSMTASTSVSASTGGGGVYNGEEPDYYDNNGEGGGLSHSGEIGVAVGVALGAVFAAAVAWFAWKKWRARRRPEYSPPELYFSAVVQESPGNTGGNSRAGDPGNGTEMSRVYGGGH